VVGGSVGFAKFCEHALYRRSQGIGSGLIGHANRCGNVSDSNVKAAIAVFASVATR